MRWEPAKPSKMALPSDYELARMCEDAYTGGWRWVSPGHTRALDRHASTGHRVVAFEGTTLDGLAILRDIRILPKLTLRLGAIPFGAYDGVASIIERVMVDCADDLRAGNLIFTGHSLGGQEAEVATAWCVSEGYTPAALVTFEPSRAGLWKLARLVSRVPVARWYDNGSPVPDVPLPYWHPCRRVDLNPRAPVPLIEYHQIARIASAVQALERKIP